MSGLRVIILTEPEFRALCAALDAIDPATLPKIGHHAAEMTRSGIYHPAPSKAVRVYRLDQERETRKRSRDGK